VALLENEYRLQEEVLQFIPSSSNLSVSSEHLARLRSAHVYVIVSGKSGAGLATSVNDNILAPLSELFGLSATVHITSSKTSHIEFLTSTGFSPDRENIIVVLGGDTMIYDLLNALPQNSYLTEPHRITISPIPCGTGNALAMSLRITSIPIGISAFFGVSKVNSVQTSPLPVLRISIRDADHERVIWAAVVCSWGLHASLVADSDDPEMRREYGAKRFGVFSCPIPANDRSRRNDFSHHRPMYITERSKYLEGRLWGLNIRIFYFPTYLISSRLFRLRLNNHRCYLQSQLY
jgi:diacylglycerol kinase family enzyme